jgi:RNA polymerase sigma factor (sigma-70 family)
VQAILRCITEHNFRQLFSEELGWEYAHGLVQIPLNGTVFHFERIAQKRGIQALHCCLPRSHIQNRPLLRMMERHVAKHAHEHILVYTDEAGRRQVWQWATWLEDKHRLRHREHPFFSNRPPNELLERLSRLRFSLEEEDTIELTEALERVTRALDDVPDVSVFFRNPRFIEESDRLAREMTKDGSSAFHRFVLLHLALAAWAAEPYKRTEIDEDDLNQIACLGLLNAAKRFDPEREVAFSTYAVPWIRQCCQRYIPSHVLRMFIRPDMYWRFRRLQRRANRRRGRGGESAYSEHLGHLMALDRLLAKHGDLVRQAWIVLTFDSDVEARQQVRRLSDPLPMPFEIAEARDQFAAVRRCVDALSDRDRKMIRLRFGFDGPEKTLEEIGQAHGLTRERVRQCLGEAQDALRTRLVSLVDLADGIAALTKEPSFRRTPESRDARSVK